MVVIVDIFGIVGIDFVGVFGVGIYGIGVGEFVVINKSAII